VKQSRKYNVSGLVEGQFEPGSGKRVLRNLIGVKGKREMDKVEGSELLRTFKRFISVYDENHRFGTANICNMHKEWLGGIYDWAGRYRQVNLTKGGFTFAAAHLIPALMIDFEHQCLALYTPCRFTEREEIAHAIAVVHVELLLIHPFREGNGRLARMLASLMTLQAQLPPLDFGMLKGKKKQEYFEAVQFGLNRNYEPMGKIFREVIERTVRLQHRSSRPDSSLL